MATRAEVYDNESSPDHSRSSSTAPVQKWTCAVRLRSADKDELVAK